MNNLTQAEENTIRFKVRWNYKEEGHLETHKEYPAPSIERLVALSEEHKIRFEDLIHGD